MGSSTNHVVRFDGLALRLDGEGLCSYTLLTVSRGSSEGSEVKLHTGPCQDSANYHQVCMKAMDVIHGSYRVLLKDDMTVRYMIYVMFKKSALTVRICSFILHMFIWAGHDWRGRACTAVAALWHWAGALWRSDAAAEIGSWLRSEFHTSEQWVYHHITQLHYDGAHCWTLR